MVEGTSHMFVTGPNVLKTVTHEEVSFEDLGGAMIHNATSAVAHFAAPNGAECLRQVRTLLSFSPSNNLDDPPTEISADPVIRTDDALDAIIPDNSNRPYDMTAIIRSVADNGIFFEVQQQFARNIIVGFARLAGRPVGIVAQNPGALAGVLDINSSDNGARFVRFCDCFNIPIVTFVDVPGFLPGVAQEHGGIIRHGAKLLYAYCEATAPKVTVMASWEEWNENAYEIPQRSGLSPSACRRMLPVWQRDEGRLALECR